MNELNKKLTSDQHKKLLTAVEIIQHGDVAVLKKIIEFTDVVEENTQKVDGIEKKVEDAVANAKEEIETLKAIPKGEDGKTPTDEELTALIKPLIPQAKDGKTPSKQEIRDLIKPLIPVVLDGVNPDPEDVVPLVMAKIKFPEYKETVLDGRQELVEKINTGKKKDLKIELAQIEGTGKLEKDILDRAVSILDQRTQFLINKSVKHDTTLSGSGTDADPLRVVSTGTALTVKDTDGNPTVLNVNTINFSNGAVTDDGNGVVTVATGVGGGGDVSSNTATSVDSEVALFSGTGGKTIKRATGTGVAHLTSGVLSASPVVTADITDANVTLAKLADVATATVFYRKTAGTGVPEVQTLATLKTDLGLTGTNSGDQTSVTGNAGTATALQNARTIGGVSFDGSANIKVGPLNSTNINATTSAELAGIISDETGSGALVFANTPTLTTAVLGSSTATTQAPADNSTKLATTAYVDNAILGQRLKEAVKYASIAALPAIVYANGSSGVGATLTGVALGAISLDSSSPSVADRVLIKNQVSDFQNGIYTVTAAGSGAAVFVLTRVADFDQAADIQTGDTVFVTAGNTLANTTWAYNGIDSPTMGTTSLTFVQAAGPGSYTAGNGIAITGVSIAIDTAVTVDKNTAQTLTNKTLTSPIISSISNTGTITLPSSTDTLVGRATTDTLTNKRITPRFVTTTQSATPTINTDNGDAFDITALAQAITSMTTNLSGTPTAGQLMTIEITDNGTARAITWGTSFASTTVTLPTTTVISTRLRVRFEWSTVTSKWECVGIA